MFKKLKTAIRIIMILGGFLVLLGTWVGSSAIQQFKWTGLLFDLKVAGFAILGFALLFIGLMWGDKDER